MQPHFTASHSHNMIWSTINNSWDEPDMIEYDSYIKNVVSTKIRAKEWGVLLDLSNWELSTPFAEQQAKEHAAWGVQNGMKHLAVVINNRALIRWQFEKIAQKIPAKMIQIFSSVDSAKEWLLEQKYELPKQSPKP